MDDDLSVSESKVFVQLSSSASQFGNHGLLRILLIAAFSFVCGIVFASFLNTKQALEKQNNLLREQLASSEEKSQARLQQLELCVRSS